MTEAIDPNSSPFLLDKKGLLNVQIGPGPDLTYVVMPLVRAMSRADLSWAARAEVSDAIRECNAHWQRMEDERRHIEQQSCQGSVSPPR